MATLPFLLPSPVPPFTEALPGDGSGGPLAPTNSLYDLAIGDIGFVYANTDQNPMVRETVNAEKDRIDQASTAGEQTLSNWWIKSQDSFHAGAGQLNLEPAFPTPLDDVRYDLSKNVDVSTPGRVVRLPDANPLSGLSVFSMVSLVVGGQEAVVVTIAGVGDVYSVLADGTTTQIVGPTGQPVGSLATDGRYVYGTTATKVVRMDPAAPTAAPVTMATYPTTATSAIVGWVKARLMLAANEAVYELNVTQTNVALGSTQLRYTHPTAGWKWQCFAASSTAIVAAGDINGSSTLTQFTLDNVSGAPVLTVSGEVCALPVGERVLSMIQSQGTYLVLGTSKGIRVGTYNTYSGALQYGPLQLGRNDPTLPCYALTARGSFVYGAGADYDEGGLLKVDLGTQIDDAGRFAWSPDLIPTTKSLTPAIAVVNLPQSNRLVFAISGGGIYLEGTTPGSIREGWVRTSRIRFGTTEPKLFKLGRVRATYPSGDVRVVLNTSSGGGSQVAFTSNPALPEFRLIEGSAEWVQLSFFLRGGATLANWSVKALPGTRKQRRLQYVLALADAETTRSGQRVRDTLSARDRLARLEDLDSSGDETVLQEYTPDGVRSTRVIVERVSFTQVNRPTRRNDLGGNVTVTLRTVEA